MAVYDKKTKLLINVPLDWAGAHLSKEAKSLVFETDEEGNIKGQAAILIDPTAAVSRSGSRVFLGDPILPANQATVIAAGAPPINCLGVNAIQFVNIPGVAMEPVRTPNIFRSVQCATAAATTIWDPAANMRFRLMGGVISFAGPILAAAAATTITFLDQAAAITLAFNAWIPVAATYIPHIAFDLKPNGYLSVAADNLLRVTLTANFTGGNIMVTVWGTEE